jgi:hypothetical protein
MTEAGTAGWIEVDADRYESESSGGGKDLEFHVYVSPYDLPEAVRGEYVARESMFFIEFKYIGEESLERQIADDYVTMYVGRHSNRLYRIAVDVDKLGARSIVIRVSKAIDTLSDRLGAKRVPIDNFRVAKDVIESYGPRLLAPIPQLAPA